MAKILLVEDDNNLREIYEARLQAEGYDIVSARDGEEALTVAMKEKPDLIISDVMMPKISGFDMLDIIRSTEETKDAKVIMMTALSQAEDKQRAEKLGADRYLVKSQVTLEDVAKVAREVLSGEAAQVADTPAPEPAATPAPEPVKADDTTPTPAPVADTPAPEPAATPAPAPQKDDAPLDNPAMTSVAPAADDTAEAKPVEKSEESAIAEQIESFLDTKSGAAEKAEAPEEPAPAPEQSQPAPEEPATKTEETPKEEAVAPAEKPKKKVIAPINDPHASGAPDLEKLAAKEEEKEQMQQIANDIATGKTTVAEAQPTATAPEPDSTTTPQPVIPHNNGTSIDGVSQPQAPAPEVKPAPEQQAAAAPEKPAIDPNSIAL